MADTEQISAMLKELEALNQEEERLRQRKEADDLRRQLAVECLSLCCGDDKKKKPSNFPK